jgi:hypothetical protein
MQSEGARGPRRSPEPRIEEQGGRAILGPNADDLEAGVTTSRDGERPAALQGKNIHPREDLLMLLQQLASVSRFGMEVQLEMTEEIKEDAAPQSRKKHSCAPRPDADAAWPAEILPRESEADVAGRFEGTVGWGPEGAAAGQNRPMDKQEAEIARPVALQVFFEFCVPMQVFCFLPLTTSGFKRQVSCCVRYALQPNVSRVE